MSELPAGFKKIRSDLTSRLSFDLTHNRFYLSRFLFKNYPIDFNQKVGMAYNAKDDQVLISLNANDFFIDSRGYITSARFAEDMRKKYKKDNLIIKYAINEQLTDDKFIVFDSADIEEKEED